MSTPPQLCRSSTRLIKANKTFALLVVPGAGHGTRGPNAEYTERNLDDFFVHNLLGQEPPDWNTGGSQPPAISESYRSRAAFHQGDIAIDRQRGKALTAATRLRPFDLDAIDLCAVAKAKDHARIVRGEITSPAHFRRLPTKIATLPYNSGADGVDV